jgi:hypothetical protein
VTDSSGASTARSDRGKEQSTNNGPAWWLIIVIAVVIVATVLLAVVLGVSLRNVLDASKTELPEQTAKAQVVVGAMTGILTIAIAFGTIWYARLTRGMLAEATATRLSEIDQLDLMRRQLDQSARALDLAKESQRLSIRPCLADVPRDSQRLSGTPVQIHLQYYGTKYTMSDSNAVLVPAPTLQHAYLVVPMRNIGSGIAMVTSISLMASNQVAQGDASQITVAPSEFTRLVFVVDRGEGGQRSVAEAIVARQPVLVSVSYTNAQGEDPLRTELMLERDPTTTDTLKVVPPARIRSEDEIVRNASVGNPPEDPHPSQGLITPQLGHESDSNS